MSTIPVIGLVGGIGSGKSSLARHVAKNLPIHIIDADRIGHEMLTRDTVRQQLVAEFGKSILREPNVIDRSKLAATVFGSENRDALAKLERVVHPQIGREIENRIQQLRDAGGIDAILLDAAVMFESGWNQRCDAVVFIDTSRDERIRRVAERGWTAEQLDQREASQWKLEQKRAACDFVVANDGDIETATNSLTDIIRQLAA